MKVFYFIYKHIILIYDINYIKKMVKKMQKDEIKERKKEIGWGKRMIKVSVSFFTDSLPEGTNNKTAWAMGTITLIANQERGLESEQVFFNNKDEFLPRLQELLEKNEVKLLKPPKKYEEVDFRK